jgi:hypothetical protein
MSRLEYLPLSLNLLNPFNEFLNLLYWLLLLLLILLSESTLASLRISQGIVVVKSHDALVLQQLIRLITDLSKSLICHP